MRRFWNGRVMDDDDAWCMGAWCGWKCRMLGWWMMLNEMMEMDVMKDVQFCVMLIFPWSGHDGNGWWGWMMRCMVHGCMVAWCMVAWCMGAWCGWKCRMLGWWMMLNEMMEMDVMKDAQFHESGPWFLMDDGDGWHVAGLHGEHGEHGEWCGWKCRMLGWWWMWCPKKGGDTCQVKQKGRDTCQWRDTCQVEPTWPLCAIEIVQLFRLEINHP